MVITIGIYKGILSNIDYEDWSFPTSDDETHRLLREIRDKINK